MTSQHIVIAGAGIGGLSAALFLARAGRRVTVLEQAAELLEAGAGIQLGANAMKVLAALGLRDAVLQTACQPQSIAIRDATTGRSISRMLLGAAAQQRYGETYCTVHRADLQAALLQAVQAEPLIVLKLGTAIQSFMQHTRGVLVTLQDGNALPADALVGADGLWSTVRAQSLHDGAPRATGHAAFRALLPAAAVPQALRQSEVGVWWGRAVHVVGYPVRSGDFWNLAILAETRDETPSRAQNSSGVHRGEEHSGENHTGAKNNGNTVQAAGWNLSATTADAQRALGNTCADLTALINAAPSWKRWNLFDRPAVTSWGEGAVTLLGDAAHPMLPYLAQGAAMALEDAAALAQCMQSATAVPQALRAYEQQRMPRTQCVVNTARRNGHIFHLRGPLAVARNAVLALKGTEVLGLPWLYAHSPRDLLQK